MYDHPFIVIAVLIVCIIGIGIYNHFKKEPVDWSRRESTEQQDKIVFLRELMDFSKETQKK